MKKVKYLLLIMIFILSVAGMAYAADEHKELLVWDSCISSDPPGTPDMLPSNPDVGSMSCQILLLDKNLQCVINNGYPEYQATVEAKIRNISSDPVKISGVKFTDKPDYVEVTLKDKGGNSLINQVINKNSTLEVLLFNRITDSAPQAASARFNIEITAIQETYSDEGGGGDDSGETPKEPVEQKEPPVKTPTELPTEPEEQKEGLHISEDLPLTGGSIAIFLGAGLLLGGIGAFMRRK